MSQSERGVAGHYRPAVVNPSLQADPFTICAVGLHLTKEIDFASVRKSLVERARPDEIPKWIVPIEFCRKAMRMTANGSYHGLFALLDGNAIGWCRSCFRISFSMS